MELRVLNYFLVVAREENITRAAELLHITQPTLSRQLMQLEEELGVSLFIRGKRKIVLTESGMILKRRAEEILSLTKKTELEVRHYDQEVNGEISIGSGMMLATHTMGEYIRDFQLLYPDVTFHFQSGNSHFVLENIDNGLLDVGIVLEPVNLEKLNFVRLNKKERWGLLMRSDSLMAKKSYITVDDLKDLPLINTGRFQTQDYFSKWYGDGYEDLHFHATSQLVDSASILVRNRVGYAIIIEGAYMNNEMKDLCFRPFFPELNSYSMIVWKKYQSYGLTVSKFIDFIIKKNQGEKSDV